MRILTIGVLFVFLLSPLLALFTELSLPSLWSLQGHPTLREALALSARSSLLSLSLSLSLGTPLAWWLAREAPRWLRTTLMAFLSLLVTLPPAVLGLALLLCFGRRGLFAPILEPLGLVLPFSESAVILAQFFVAIPLYLLVASAAFQSLDQRLIWSARGLGCAPRQLLWRVAIPSCLPALTPGAALSWARALGEFGATLLFAGRLSGVSETMPLAIYAALEEDERIAIAIAILLCGSAGLALIAAQFSTRIARISSAHFHPHRSPQEKQKGERDRRSV